MGIGVVGLALWRRVDGGVELAGEGNGVVVVYVGEEVRAGYL